MLVKGQIANEIIQRLEQISKIEQTDYEKAIRDHAAHVEQYVFEAIKSLTITIPSGALQIQTESGPGFNVQPIILNLTIS